MKVLVTGATGFIGSCLVQRLAKDGFEIICLVRKTSSKERIKELAKIGAQICYGDVTDQHSLKHLPTDIDVIYHLAALLDHSLASYEPYHRVNVNGTRNLVEYFLGSDLKKFVFMSSIAAIGLVKTETGFVGEGVRCSPTTFYGKSKYEAEKILIRYFNDFKFPIIILRAPTVYGPSSKNSFREMVKFVKRKIERRRPIVYIDRGSALTSLCYIDNLINALMLAMKSKYIGEIFHIDDGRPYTHKEILNAISNALGEKPIEVYIPHVILYPFAFVNEFLNAILKIGIKDLSMEKVRMLSTSIAFDVSKARQRLGYKPMCKLEVFVGKTVAEHRKNKLL